MNETIDTISEELWEQLRELLEEKLTEFGVTEDREAWTKTEVSTKLIMKLENDYLTESQFVPSCPKRQEKFYGKLLRNYYYEKITQQNNHPTCPST